MAAPERTFANGHGGSAPPGGLLPPQSLEAEQSVLGAVLLSDQTLYALRIEINLRPEDFYRPAHAAIYDAMLALYEQGEPVDKLTVTEKLKQSGQLESAGGAAAIEALAAAPPVVGNAKQYGKIVKDTALVRGLLTATYRIQQQVSEHAGNPLELLDQAERSILEIGHDDRRKDFRGIFEVLETEIEKLTKLAEAGQEITGTPSGFPDLDEITGGFQPGNLIVLAARPSMGKCLRGSALVYDPWSGGRRRIDELVADLETGCEEAWVAALGADLKLRPARITRGFRNGRRPVYCLRTKLGRRVEATINHPLLTIEGWRQLGDLRAGDRIAVPRHLPRCGLQQTMPDHEIVMLAALISDGSLTGRTPRFCFGPDSPVLHVVEEAAADFGARINPSDSRVRSKTNVDTVPPAAWESVLGAKGERSWAEVSAAAGHPRNHNWHVGRRGISRPQLSVLAEATGSDDLARLAESDVWWDEVASVEHIGDEETFDLTVPGHHNFVADDVIVHNSSLAANFLENAAVRHNRPAVMFSLEMGESELAQRFIASQGSIKGNDLRKGKVNWSKVTTAVKTLGAAPLWIDDSSDLSVLDIRAKARRLAQQVDGELGLIVVDYLQLMRSDSRSDSVVEQIGEISKGLKTLARELMVPVIALSQLSRAVEQRHDKKPMLSDLRSSGQIEQDADLVMFIYREEYYEEDSEKKGEAELLISKHRNGSLGNVPLVFQNEYPRFMPGIRDADRYG